MKTALKYLGVVALAMVALTWPSVNVLGVDENPAAREAFRRLQLQDKNGQIPPNALMEAYGQKQAMPFLSDAWSEFPNVPGWISIGPGNIGGRTRSIVIHPTIPTTMWLGAVAGGVWKTTNGGVSWSTNTDSLANLAVNCMAIDPANPNTLYAGTGEGFFNFDGVQGYGIYKTTDGGDHWDPLSSTIPSPANPDFYFVNRLAISPTNSQLLLAATRSNKILRSTDGGTTWSTRLIAPTTMDDVRFRPNTAPPPDVPDVFAIQCVAGSFRGDVYYSNDDGLNWSLASGLPPPAEYQRVELAYSRSNPLIVYASVAANNGELYQSTNGGFSFNLMGAPPGVGTRVTWYANALWVDPFNPNTVVVGGERDLWRTTQGGAGGWVGSTGTHQDHHVIIEHPNYNGGTNTIVYGGNDGGIYRTNDVLASQSISWKTLNNNLAITQFYGGAGNVATGKIIGGNQDNGTVRFRPQDGSENWMTMFGGDGGFCAADQTDPNYFYGEYINLRIYRSTNGGDPNSAQYIWSGPNGIPADCGDGPCANFIAPFVLDPTNPNTLLAGGKSLWRSTDVKNVPPSPPPTWAAIKSPVGTETNYIAAIAVAPGQSNTIWVGYNDGSVFYTTNGTATTPTWIPGDPHGLLPHDSAHFCTRITIGPPSQLDPQVGFTKYVTFGGFNGDNVWKTTDSGQTWTPIHHNLPIAPIRSLVISPSNPDRLYVGTEVGVFASVDGGMTWSPGVPGVPGPANTRVDELFWMGNKLVAATHGRSMFTIAAAQ
jgi:photosystem II stability/assembly factor-like uncharacterized protein